MDVVNPTKIKIIVASYGTTKKAINVTQKIQAIVDQGEDYLVVNEATLGDPVPGEEKHFGMVYRIGEREESVACKEGERIHLI